MQSISDKLKQTRLAANLTQDELAMKLGISRQTISNWENGRSYPDIVNVIALSDVYDVSLDSLLKGDNEMIKHLKESTNTVKSNKRLFIGLGLFVIFYAAGFVMQGFGQGFPIGAILFNIICSSGMIVAAIVVITRAIGKINLTEIKAQYKTLLKTAITVPVVLLYCFIVVSFWLR